VLLTLLGAAPAHTQVSLQRRGVVISVRVTDQDRGGLLDQVRLDLLQFTGVVVQTIFTDSSGRAQFGPVGADHYIVQASRAGFQTYRVDVDPTPGQTQYDLSIQLPAIEANPNKPGGVISARELSIPEGAREEFKKGLEFLNEKKDPKQCIIHFQNAVANFPNYYEAYFLLGVAHLETNSPSEGQTALRKAIELNPKFLEPYYPLADLLVRQKQYEEAERLLLQALTQDKQDWRWPFELAFAYAKQGQWDKAMEYGQMASARPNAPSKVHLLMADLYSNTGNTSKAIAELEGFEKIDPHSSYIPRVQQVLSELRKQNLTGQQKPAAAPPER
jgi:tetratricopeptide (TPR) repeat protein